MQEIRYVRDIYRFRLYEIVPTDKFINFDFCGSMVMGYSNKFIFLMDLNTKEISKFIKIPKNLIFNSAYCDEIGRVIFLTYSPTILGISKAYLYDIQSEKFFELFSTKDPIMEPIYFKGGFVVSPDKEGFHKILSTVFYFIPYNKMKPFLCNNILSIQKNENNEILILSGDEQRICQTNLNHLETRIVYKLNKSISMNGLKFADGVFYFYTPQEYSTETVVLYKLFHNKIEALKKVDWFTEFAVLDRDTIIYGTATGKFFLIRDKKEKLLYSISPKFAYSFPSEEERCSYCFKISSNGSGILFKTKKAIVILRKNVD